MTEQEMGPPPWLNAPPVSEYPFTDTDNVREGPDVHKAVLSLLPLLGRWRGRGRGGYPTLGEDFDYGQEIRFSHDGRPFLAYESRTWLLDADNQPIRPASREVGWWRPQPDSTVEVLLSQPTGIMELYVGTVDGLKFELQTDAVMRTASAKEVTAGHRLYGIVEGALMYAYDMAAEGQPLTPHLSARLERY